MDERESVSLSALSEPGVRGKSEEIEMDDLRKESESAK